MQQSNEVWAHVYLQRAIWQQKIQYRAEGLATWVCLVKKLSHLFRLILSQFCFQQVA